MLFRSPGYSVKHGHCGHTPWSPSDTHAAAPCRDRGSAGRHGPLCPGQGSPHASHCYAAPPGSADMAETHPALDSRAARRHALPCSVSEGVLSVVRDCLHPAQSCHKLLTRFSLPAHMDKQRIQTEVRTAESGCTDIWLCRRSIMFPCVCRKSQAGSTAYDSTKPGERYLGPWTKLLPTRSKTGHGGVPRASRGRDMSPPYPLTRAARDGSARRAASLVPGRGNRGDQR